MLPRFSLPRRILRAWKQETSGFHFKLLLVNLLLQPLPFYMGSRLRAFLYRLIGFRIAKGVTIWGKVVFDASGDVYPRLTVGRLTSVAHCCFINLNGPVTIGDNVVIAYHTKIITDNHLLGHPWRRMGKRVSLPVIIEDGVFICAGATIMPGVTIGWGSVVAAGSVVTKDVPPNTMVGGVPAIFIKKLPMEKD